MEPITLSLASPKVSMPGLDEGIGKLERLDGLLEKIAKYGRLRITVKVEGLENIDGAIASVNDLKAALARAGAADIASKLDKGLISVGEAAHEAAMEVARLQRELSVAQAKSVTMQGKFESLEVAIKGNLFSANKIDLFAGAKKELDAVIAHADAVQKKLSAMQRVAGMAEGMTGTPDAAKASTSGAVAGEKNLAAAVDQSAAAMDGEAASVRKKIAALNDLAGINNKVAASESEVGSATRKASNEAAVAGEKSRRMVMDARGNIKGMAVTYQGNPGETITKMGVNQNGAVTRTISQIESLQAELANVKADYGARRASISEAGQGKGTPDQINLLRQEVLERQAVLEKMKAAGLENDKMYRSETIRTRAMEETANYQQQANAKRNTEDMHSNMSDRLDSGFRERAALLDREYSSQKQVSMSRVEEIDLLRRQAAGYQQLSEAMIAAKRGGEPGQLGAQKKAEVMGVQASQIEREMQAEAQRISEMTSRFQREFQGFGGNDKKTAISEGPSGRTVTSRSQRDDADGYRQMIELTRRWDAAGNELLPTLSRTSTALEATGRSATAAGKSMLDNLGSITAWASAVAILYKSIALLTFGLESMTKIEFQTARLSAVFRGSNEELNAQSSTIVSLRDRTLELASANGRGGDEALDAAVKWARLGLTQRETLEAVDVSLKAANVAEMSTGEAAESLSAIFAAYGLQVGELRTVLNEVNTITNSYNVTNKDLFQGLSRSASIASQAGIAFSELVGIIASGVGRTGRSGSEIGNTVKALIVSLSNPKLQGFLKSEFKFDVKTPTGDLKDMSTMLNEIYTLFQKLGKADQGEFLQKVGGKMQASRLQALMDGYVTGQMLAIKAQRDLGSADRENEKIRATTLSQLSALSTAYQRLATNILMVGGDFGMARQFSAIIELLTNIIRLMGNWPGLLLLVGTVAAIMGVKIATAMAAAAKDTGILGRTIVHLRTLWIEFGEAVAVANGQLARHNALATASPKGAVGSSLAAHFPGYVSGPNGTVVKAGASTAIGAAAGTAAGVGARAAGGSILRGLGSLLGGVLAGPEILTAIAVTAAVEGGIWAINKAFHAFSTNADTAAEKLGVYNKELERTHGLAGAADQSARLARTIGQDVGTFGKTNPRRLQREINDYSEIAYSREEDPSGRRRAEFKEEMSGLLAAGKIKELQSRFEKEDLKGQHQKQEYSSQELRIRMKALDVQGSAIAALEKEIDLRQRAGKDTIEQDKQLQDARKAQQALRGEVSSNFTATYDADETPASELNKEASTRFTRQFKGMESVMGAYPTTAPDDDAEKIQRKIDLIGQEIQALDDARAATKSTGELSVKTANSEFEATQKQWQMYGNLNAARDHYAGILAKASARTRAERQFAAGVPEGMQGEGSGQALAEASKQEDQARTMLEEFDRMNEVALKREAELRQAVQETGQAAIDAKKKAIAEDKATGAEADTFAAGGGRGSAAAKKGSLEEAREELQVQLEYARVQDAIAQGKRKARQETVQFQTGRNETEQLLSEAKGIGVDPSGGLIGKARGERETALGRGDKVAESRAEAEILQLTNRLTEVGVSLEERRFKLARDIVNEKIKEQQEASKSLLMAGREDQLRAALIRKFTDQSGGFTSDQFAFLDPSTKEAVTKFNPESAPKELGSRAREMDDEQKLLIKSLNEMSAAIQAAADDVRKNIKLNTAPAPAGADALNNPPQIVAPPPINLQFSDQFERMIALTNQTVTAALEAEIGVMNSKFDAFVARFRTGAAQQGGADTMAASG